MYRIPVNGLDIGIIYRISYKGQKPHTFKAYESGEMKINTGSGMAVISNWE